MRMPAWHESLSARARARARVYPLLLLAGYVAIGGLLLFSGSGRVDRFGKPIGSDFVTFYAASELVRAGAAARSYDLAAIGAAERAVIGAPIDAFAFHYPPPVLALLAPLSIVPYPVALAAFTLLSLAAFAWAVRRLAPDRVTGMCALAAPALFQTLIHGQAAAFIAALFGAGCSLLARRPRLAGVVLGGLILKPHFLPLVVLGLAGLRRWPAFIATLASAAAIALASLAVLGSAPWRAFQGDLGFTLRLLTEGGLPLHKMPTVSAALLLIGAPASLALALQACVSVGCALALIAIVRCAPPLPIACAAMAAATLAALPFAFEYDWCLGVLALLWLAQCVPVLSRGELALWSAVWSAPLLWSPVALATRVQLGPWLALGLLAHVYDLARSGVAHGPGRGV